MTKRVVRIVVNLVSMSKTGRLYVTFLRDFLPQHLNKIPKTGPTYGKNAVVKILVKMQFPYTSNQFFDNPFGSYS